MVYIRLAAAAALVASLAGCSVVGSSDPGAKYPESNGPAPARPAQSVRLAALPGYLANQDIVPDKPSGFVGIPSRRPQPAVAPVRPAASPVLERFPLTWNRTGPHPHPATQIILPAWGWFGRPSQPRTCCRVGVRAGDAV